VAQNILLYTESQSFVLKIRQHSDGLNYNFRTVSKISEIEQLESGYAPLILIVDFRGDGAMLRNIYDKSSKKFRFTKLIVLFENKLPFDFDEMGTRRINMTFIQSPFEEELLLDYLLEFAPVEITGPALKFTHLAPVRISDIRPDQKFKFNLYFYMAANRKALLYRKKDSTLSGDQIRKFESKSIHDLYVLKTELKLFNEFAAKSLASSFENKNIPSSERRLLLQKKVKDLFGSFFDSSIVDARRNKAVLNTCKQVVGQFITEISPRSSAFEQILFYTAQLKSNYNHSINVSVYTSLFALALGNTEIEAAALGGMLHDVGLSSLPAAIAKKKYKAMTDEEKEIYHSHPLEGVKLLQGKKILGNVDLFAIIEQHHERTDGKGYPKKISGGKINFLAKLCHIADEFDELTSINIEEEFIVAPKDAILKMMNEPDRFDVELLTQLKEILFGTKDAIDLELAKKQFDTPAEVPSEEWPAKDLRRRKRYKKAI
jgi:HD-GYP domain-containing protein (c-di-GMP phosphodiesterase class II)